MRNIRTKPIIRARPIWNAGSPRCSGAESSLLGVSSLVCGGECPARVDAAAIASIPSGRMTIKQLPTSKPAPREATSRSCDCDRAKDNGRAPARKELSANKQSARAGQERGRTMAKVDARNGHDHLCSAIGQLLVNTAGDGEKPGARETTHRGHDEKYQAGHGGRASGIARYREQVGRASLGHIHGRKSAKQAGVGAASVPWPDGGGRSARWAGVAEKRSFQAGWTLRVRDQRSARD